MTRIKQIRLKNYDYKTNGYYFVTAVCDQRFNYFEKNELMVENELRDAIKKISGCLLDYFVIMPNHVHIIFILNNSSLNLSEVVRRFKAKVSYAFKKPIWQPNYYEHVIRNERALKKIREYIVNNPQSLLLKFDQFYL